MSLSKMTLPTTQFNTFRDEGFEVNMIRNTIIFLPFSIQKKYVDFAIFIPVGVG